MTKREFEAAMSAAAEVMITSGVRADEVLTDFELEIIVRAALAAAEQVRADELKEAMG